MGSKQTTAQIVEAGGLIPPGAKVKSDRPVDTLSARAYLHPGLGDNVVVRLTPSALAIGVDLEMDVLGFGNPEDRGKVGQQRRRTLGFPGWALMNDPDHAQHALDVLKAFKKEARIARSKPGFAVQGIGEIGKRLGRSVPHFLPSFYEEAGRTFIELGNMNYAAQMFEKAREAERVHALAIDENLRRESFLEFALAGAVTIKSLTNYAKDLVKSFTAAEAYDHFRQLAVQRTLGGMPPWGTMSKELRKLAKAAGHDVGKEEEAVLKEIIDSPSLAKAALGFWKGYRKSINRLAKKDAAVRVALLNLFPSPPQEDDGFEGDWLDLLDECGALDMLVTPSKSAELAPADSPAAWFSKLMKHNFCSWGCNPSSPQAFALLRRLAPTLKKGGEPIRCTDWYRKLDLDMTDLALELGLAVVDDPERIRLDLDDWSKEAQLPQRGRDPVHVAANENLAGMLYAALDEVMGSEPFEGVTRGMSGFKAVKETWLLERIEEAGHGGLPDCSRALERLRNATSAQTYSEFPDAYARLKEIQLSPPLHRTLKEGILDELGWPALEIAVAGFDCPPEKLFITGSFPHLIVTDQLRVVVLGPGGVVKEFELRLPKRKQLQAMRFVDGEVLVVFGEHYDAEAYWSNAPQALFKLGYIYGYDSVGGLTVPVAGGGVVSGKRALQVGDTALPETEHVLCDGEVFWRRDWHKEDYCLREFNPRTGEKGRISAPTFLEEYSRDGMQLDLSSSWIAPLPEGLRDSPLGTREGLIGWRARRRDEDSPLASSVPIREHEGIDGRRFEGMFNDKIPIGLLSLPGTGKPLPVALTSYWGDDGDATWIGPGEGNFHCSKIDDEQHYCAGTPVVLPPVFWHLFEPRDIEGSRFLRALKSDGAVELLRVAAAVLEETDEEQLKKAGGLGKLLIHQTEIIDLLTSIDHSGLKAGVVGITAHAAQIGQQLQAFIERCAPGNAPEVAPVLLDEQIAPVLESFLDHNYYYSDDLASQLTQVADFFTREERQNGQKTEVAESRVTWERFIGAMQTVAYLASMELTSKEHRELLLSLLEIWSQTPFAGDLSKYRLIRFQIDEKFWGDHPLFTQNGNDYFVRPEERYWGSGERCIALEYAASGRFNMIEGATLLGEHKPTMGWGSPEQLDAFKSLLNENGPRVWDPQAPIVLAEQTGIPRAEACLLLSAFVNFESYQNNFLPKRLREQMGLKVAEAKAAKQGVERLPSWERAIFIGAAFDQDPASLWNPADADDAPAGRLAQAWIARFGKRAAIPEALLAHTDKAIPKRRWGRFGKTLAAVDALPIIAAPQDAPCLVNDSKWEVDQEGKVITADDEPGFDSATLYAVATLVPYLFEQLPVGDPIRNQLPQAVNLARQRLESKQLLFSLGSDYIWSDDDDLKTVVARALDAVGGTPLAEPLEGRDTGACVVVHHSNEMKVAFRPHQVKDPSSLRQIESLSAKYTGAQGTLAQVKFVLSKRFGGFAKRVENSPVELGGYEANPALSVPRLVEQVGARFDMSEDAAVLYLQTLALIAPTNKSIGLWNGWKPARLKKAVKELAERRLVLEAKRSRAGRGHFLPGGWEPLKSPHPPLETWKMPLYQLCRVEGTIQVDSPIGPFLPMMPHHELFQQAWDRVLSGDAPAYEEVK